MELVSSTSTMATSTKESTSMAFLKDLASIFGRIKAIIKEISSKV